MAELRSLIINDTGSLEVPSGDNTTRPSYSETVDTFTSTGTTSWTAPAGVTKVEVLVVAGGGRGGVDNAGGGGAGGLIYNPAYEVNPGSSYVVTVGAGGGSNTTAESDSPNGGNSVFDTLVALGGGGGGTGSGSDVNRHRGRDGGSGGGQAGEGVFGGYAGQGTPGQGHNGGESTRYPSTQGAGGGGGGAGGPGRDGSTDGRYGGAGGPGLEFSISGTPTYYAGGGAGGNNNDFVDVQALGGAGGGGNGFSGTTIPSDAPGVNGTGGGGAGGGYISTATATGPRGETYTGGGYGGARGGDGIVIIRYATPNDNKRRESTTRLNTQTRTVEVFGENNQWNTVSEDIVRDGLIIHLDARKHNGGSTWYDLSPSNLSVPLVNSPQWDGESITFNGSDQSAEIGLVPAAGSVPELSFSVWAKFLGSDSVGGSILRNRLYGYGLNVSNGAFNYYVFTNNSTPRSYATSRLRGGYKPNTWHHLQVTIGRNQQAFYIDGELVDSQYYPEKEIFAYAVAGQDNDGYIALAKDGNGGGGYLNCSIASCMFYSRALTGHEVYKNYIADASRFGHQGGDLEAVASANDLKGRGATTSGPYLIRTADGGNNHRTLQTGAVKTWCELDRIDGGGWTLIGKSGGGLWHDPDRWLKDTVNPDSMLNLYPMPTNQYACIDARLVAGGHASEIMISNHSLTRWVKVEIHTDATPETIFNHGVQQAAIAASNHQSKTSVAWNGSGTACYVNPYMVMGLGGHGGSTPAWTFNTAGNTNVNEYAMAVACASSNHNGFTVSGNHNGQDAPFSDTDWPNAAYNGSHFYGLVWCR